MSSGKIFDGIHREAVDVAAAMMFSKGEKLITKPISPHIFHTFQRPEIITGSSLKRRLNGTEDLTGKIIGRFRVIGFSKDTPKRWIVQCVCGAYEQRSSKALRNPSNIGDGCHQCRRIDNMKRKHDYRTFGRSFN